MRSFNDSKGREWIFNITIDTCRRVRNANLGVDLMNIEAGNPPAMTRIATDPMLLCDVAWCAVEPQAAALTPPIDSRVFGQSLGGKAIADMQAAFWEAVTDFFQSLNRTHVVTAIQAQMEMIEAGMAKSSAALMQAKKDFIAGSTGSTSTDGSLPMPSPESAESTPAPSASVN